MRDLADIVQQRKTPGVLILAEDGRPLFMNEMIGQILPAAIPAPHSPATPAFPEEILALCGELSNNQGVPSKSACSFIYGDDGHPYSLRAFPMGAAAPDSPATHIMVLVEQVIDQHQIDFSRVQNDYGLSRRETEVLKVVCQGLSNRQIAERLFISEHTVKDHLKRILQALGVASRSEIIAALRR